MQIVTNGNIVTPTPEQERQINSIMSRIDTAITIDQIFHAVEDVAGKNIAIRNKKRDVVIFRQLYCYLACRLTKCVLKNIAALINNRDHTTIIHGRDTYQMFLDSKDLTTKEIAISYLESACTILGVPVPYMPKDYIRNVVVPPKPVIKSIEPKKEVDQFGKMVNGKMKRWPAVYSNKTY